MDQSLVNFLNEKADQYNDLSFIPDDPITIPHQFERKEDIEIIGFLVATIAWGNRKSIIKSGNKMVEQLQGQPYDFIMNASDQELNDVQLVHRTFNSDDFRFFLNSIKSIYTKGGGLEQAFSKGENIYEKICNFRHEFLLYPHEPRVEKHVSNPAKGSSCKRINMYLRWMVRKDKRKVDFGIWDAIDPSELYVPLDVHVGNVARELGILRRKSNDWKALEELMTQFKAMDAKDPAKYDFALFGLGINNDLE